MHLGIDFQKGSLALSAYCDADWAGDPIDRRSITGMVVFLGNSPITWLAKKQPSLGVLQWLNIEHLLFLQLSSIG